MAPERSRAPLACYNGGVRFHGFASAAAFCIHPQPDRLDGSLSKIPFTMCRTPRPEPSNPHKSIPLASPKTFSNDVPICVGGPGGPPWLGRIETYAFGDCFLIGCGAALGGGAEPRAVFRIQDRRRQKAGAVRQGDGVFPEGRQRIGPRA